MIRIALLAFVLAAPTPAPKPAFRELRVGDAIDYQAKPLPSPQAAPQPARQWITLSNFPGLQALGRIVNGWVVDITQTRPVPVPMPAPAAGGDAYGVGSWLNATRARSGLNPLAYDAGLSANAQANSAAGFGHNLPGYGRGQVVGMGALGAVESAWISDPPHAAILLMPGVTRYGLGVVGNVWTINVN